MSFQIHKRVKPGVYKPTKLAPFATFHDAAKHIVAKVKPENRTSYVIRRAEVQS